MTASEFRDGVRILAVPLEQEMVEQICDYYENVADGKIPYNRVVEALNWFTFDAENFLKSSIGTLITFRGLNCSILQHCNL